MEDNNQLSAENQHELMRREFWIKIAVAVASTEGCSSSATPTKWASKALADFDTLFKPLNMNKQSGNIKD